MTDETTETITIRNRSGQIVSFTLKGEAGEIQGDAIRKQIRRGDIELWDGKA